MSAFVQIFCFCYCSLALRLTEWLLFSKSLNRHTDLAYFTVRYKSSAKSKFEYGSLNAFCRDELKCVVYYKYVFWCKYLYLFRFFLYLFIYLFFLIHIYNDFCIGNPRIPRKRSNKINNARNHKVLLVLWTAPVCLSACLSLRYFYPGIYPGIFLGIYM